MLRAYPIRYPVNFEEVFFRISLELLCFHNNGLKYIKLLYHESRLLNRPNFSFPFKRYGRWKFPSFLKEN